MTTYSGPDSKGLDVNLQYFGTSRFEKYLDRNSIMNLVQCTVVFFQLYREANILFRAKFQIFFCYEMRQVQKSKKGIEIGHHKLEENLSSIAKA